MRDLKVWHPKFQDRTQKFAANGSHEKTYGIVVVHFD